VDELSLDAWVNDLATVVDAAGVERFPLLAMSHGCAISIAYAVKYPARVSHLILYGGFALGSSKRTSVVRINACLGGRRSRGRYGYNQTGSANSCDDRDFRFHGTLPLGI
jgi:pimeloyl-ACP methyl ester carboxylesterase